MVAMLIFLHGILDGVRFRCRFLLEEVFRQAFTSASVEPTISTRSLSLMNVQVFCWKAWERFICGGAGVQLEASYTECGKGK